jgi:hypothetical protein
MNSRELVDHIRSGPEKLVLDDPLRFRRRTRSNPCYFNEFLQALQYSETIRDITCRSQQHLGIAEEEWVLLVKAIGRIEGIDELLLHCAPGSRDFHPFQAVADAVKNAQSLRKLAVVPEGGLSDQSGLAAFTSALRGHTTLHTFAWAEFGSTPEAALQVTAHDPLLRVLSACPNLQKIKVMTKYASHAAMKRMLQLTPATELRLILHLDQWLAVTDEIRQGRCNVQKLTLGMFHVTRSETTEAIKALASAMRLDRNLKHLQLRMENGYTDEAVVALAEALTLNKTLLKITLSVTHVFPGNPLPNRDALGAQSYEALAAMLRVNTNLRLGLPPFETTGAYERLRESRNQMIIEQVLNLFGRGRLLSLSQTTRKEWVDALTVLNSYNSVDETPEFNVSCLYSLLRLNPAICMLKLDGTSNPGDFKKMMTRVLHPIYVSHSKAVYSPTEHGY